MSKYIYLIFLILFFNNAIAATGVANNFEVDYVRVDSSGKGYVEFKSDLLAEPATCMQLNYSKSLAFDTNTAGGKSILSVVLMAKASGKLIYARGTGLCGVYGVMEDWSWGSIQ